MNKEADLSLFAIGAIDRMIDAARNPYYSEKKDGPRESRQVRRAKERAEAKKVRN